MTAPIAPYATIPPQPPKKVWWKNSVVIGGVCLIVGAAAGFGIRGAGTASSTTTVTATVTASATDPLAPAEQPSNGGPVEGEATPAEQENGGDFQIGRPYTLSDGSTLTFGQPVKQTRSYDSLSYYKFPFTYTNNSQKEFSPFGLSVQATNGTVAAESVIDTAGGCDLATTSVLPGKTLEWAYCFQADAAKPFTLQWSVLFASDKGHADMTLPS
jgi:hypothetical protein